jgi:23S rRNA (pseudouridine1915-N3)-methyltransferase
MKLAIIAVGKLKRDAEATLFARYVERLDLFAREIALGPLALVEIAEARGSAQERQRSEAASIIERVPKGWTMAALDETGEMLDSMQFAAWLRILRDGGVAGLAFAIGGDSGHGELAISRAQKVISLSRMTLTHGLARVLLAEQLYRAATIISGRPYHRA